MDTFAVKLPCIIYERQYTSSFHVLLIAMYSKGIIQLTKLFCWAFMLVLREIAFAPVSQTKSELPSATIELGWPNEATLANPYFLWATPFPAKTFTSASPESVWRCKTLIFRAFVSEKKMEPSTQQDRGETRILLLLVQQSVPHLQVLGLKFHLLLRD